MKISKYILVICLLILSGCKQPVLCDLSDNEVVYIVGAGLTAQAAQDQAFAQCEEAKELYNSDD